MKKFLKFLGAVAAVFTAVIGALAVLDRLLNRTKQSEYLECKNDDSFDTESVQI